MEEEGRGNTDYRKANGCEKEDDEPEHDQANSKEGFGEPSIRPHEKMVMEDKVRDGVDMQEVQKE